MTEHRFGGSWTEEKLSRLRKYLRAYMKIFGPGFRKDPSSKDELRDTLFDDVVSDTDADALRKGSAQVALETAPPFAEYVFIEHAPDHAQELGRLRSLFPALSQKIHIVREDANEYLREWSESRTGTRRARLSFSTLTGCRLNGRRLPRWGPPGASIYESCSRLEWVRIAF